jgi:hypothetical protein
MRTDESNTIERLIDAVLYYGLIAVAVWWTAVQVGEALT